MPRSSHRNAVRKSIKRRPRFAPRLEALEHRVVPVIDPYQPMPVPPGYVTVDGVPLDGVVQLNWPLPGGRTGVCTGAFLGDDERQGSDDTMTLFTRAGNAQHILTAAHCLTNESGAIDVPTITVSFYLPSRATPFVFMVPSANYRVHPNWNGDSEDGNDIALIDLGEIGPMGPNGIGATPFPINTVPDEGEKQFEFAGYGNTGTGSGGQQTGTTGTKRYGYNVIDCSGGNQLSYDFDSGDWWDNTLDPVCGSAETPVKTHDSMMGQGDSGGPNFLYDAIAGITSYGFQINELGDPDFDFGDIGVVERVSAHRDWIRGLMDVPRDVTLKMANQPFGGDGGADRIDVDRDGSRILIWVNGNFWVDLPKAGVNSLTIVGSSDNEDVHIQASLGEKVAFNGNGGANRMLIKDTPDAVTCTANVSQVSCNKGISYATTAIPQNVNYLEIAGGTRDSVFVHGVKSGTPLTVWHASTVDVGNGTMTDINDVVTVHKALTVNIRDSANASATDYDVRWSKVEVNTSGTVRTVNPFNVTFVNILGGSGGNEFTVFDTSAVQTRLYTGLGLDFTTVRASSPGSVSIYGQASNDVVQLGFNQSVQAIRGTVNISNQGGFTTTNVENHADAAKRTVILGNSTAGYVELSGLAPGKIRVEGNSVNNLNIWAGPAGNTFYVLTTPLGAGSALTNIRTGTGDDWMNVYGTKGSLKVDGQAGTNLFYVGSWDAGLNQIDGTVDLSGPGGVNTLDVYGLASTTSHDYVINSNLVHRTDKEMIFHQNMSNLSLFAGSALDKFFVKDTGPTTTIYANGIDNPEASDYVSVERTTAPLNLDLALNSWIDVGNSQSSLDNIQGKINVFPWANNQMTLSMHDDATTTSRAIDVSGTASGQTFKRTTDGGLQWLTLVDVLGVPVANLEHWGGSGGTTVYLSSTSPNTHSTFHGHAGAWDTFAIGFGTDMNNILGAVSCFGQAADHDFAYYYEYHNPNPQTYTVSTSLSGAMLVQRPGVADVQCSGLEQVVFFTPVVGGNTVDVRSVPATTLLNMPVGDGDVVTLGSNAPNLGGNLAGIAGPVVVSAYANPSDPSDVTFIVDDSGNTDLTPRRAELFTSPSYNAYYEALEDLAPAGIYWNLGTDSSVSIFGGAAPETFALLNTNFVTPIHIDGGGGVNELDYASYNPAMPGLVSWWKGDGNALDAVSSRHGTLVGNTTFAPGKVGQAFSFDGDGDYVKVSNAACLEPKNVSVEAWVNSTTLTEFGEYNYILAKGAAEYRGASYALVTSNNSGLWFYVGNGSAFGYSPDPGSGIWDGNWHHVVGTYDGNFIRLYVDGAEVGNGSPWNILGYGLPDTNDLYIGTYGGIAGYSFDGLIDEPSVFNRALSAAEVQKMYQAGSAGKSTLATGVTVNLRNSTASGLAGGITNIQNVIGSSSHDILVGNGGNVLTGGAGRDLLIAGLTAGQLFGGEDDDILIGGTTSHDQNEASLNAIRDIWTSSADYNSRVESLKGELLGAGNVFSNSQQNTLHGQAGRDFFFASPLDLNDGNDDEEFTWL